MKFLKRNPGYGGKVSIYAHSLGSVLSYSILSHQESSYSPFMESIYMEGMRKQETPVDASYKSITSKGSAASENSIRDRNDVASEHSTCSMVEGSSTSNPYPTACEDNTQDLCCTPSPFPKEVMHNDFSKNNCISNPEEFHSSDLLKNDEDQYCTTLLEDDNKKIKCHSGVTDFAEETGSLADPITTNKGFEGDAVQVAGRTSEGVVDKKKLISLLEEEVKSLRARIAELETNHQCTTYFNSQNNECPEFSHCIGKKAQSTTELYRGQDNSRKSYTPYIKYTKLDFKVDSYFAVGSPLGVFFALRNICIGIGRGQDYWHDERVSEEMSSCLQMFNIFHPFDPGVYRLEPLICKEYISRRLVIIPYHRGGKRMHIEFQVTYYTVSSNS